jgi:hypothetical protein
MHTHAIVGVRGTEEEPPPTAIDAGEQLSPVYNDKKFVYSVRENTDICHQARAED